MSKIGIYPGTFDPMTTGHMDIVKRSLKIVDNLVIVVAKNTNKDTLFNLKERIEIINNDITSLNEISSKINVTELSGLLTTFAKIQNATCIIRGLRAVSDFEYEFQMVGMNRVLSSEIETVFLMADNSYQPIASKLVKEIARLGGNTKKFVPNSVYKRLINIKSKKK